MLKPISGTQRESLSNMGSDVNKASSYPIEIPTSTGVASNIYSRLELNNALDKSISNPLKKALLQGTMDIEVGNQGPVTESAYYRLSTARKMFNNASVNRALASLSNSDRKRANKNLPVEALGLALFDDVYDGGSNYRGRGLIQITGLSNYRAVQDKLAENGINVDLVNKPELVNNTKYALPAALAFLDYAGLNDKTANTMSTKKLNNLINSGANAKIANERWDSVINALKSAGKKEEAADMALRNEYKAQKKVGVTQDGSIGPISRKAMLSWLDKKGVTIRPDNDDDMELVKLVNRTK
jgi:putative chitinase